jgi:hypothetical protein
MTMDVELVGLDEFQVRLGNISASMSLRIVDAMNEIVEVVANKARDRMAQLFRNPERMQASVSTGVFATSDEIVGTIGAYDLPYLRIQEFGGVTSPHDIFPINGKALAFFWPGGAMPFKPGAATGDMAFLKVVHHPGSRIPERSYMRSALAMERSDIVAMLQAAISEGEVNP